LFIFKRAVSLGVFPSEPASEWFRVHGACNLKTVKPVPVAACIEQFQQDHARPSVKQQLATILTLLNGLVTGRVVDVRPAGPLLSLLL